MKRPAQMSAYWRAALVSGGLIMASGQAWPGAATAEERLFIYPAAGQSESQRADDRYACHERALQESGFDPTRAALVSRATPAHAVIQVPPNESEGATGKGMVTGAVAGAVLGAAAGEHAGKSAVVGAAVGTLIGSAVERNGAAAAESQARAEGARQLQQSEDRAARLAGQRARYKAGFSRCLEERGYTVR